MLHSIVWSVDLSCASGMQASESREKACASCVNYANQLVYFALFPAAVLYSVHRDCQYWQSITNALLSSREAQVARSTPTCSFT